MHVIYLIYNKKQDYYKEILLFVKNYIKKKFSNSFQDVKVLENYETALRMHVSQNFFTLKIYTI